MSDQGNPVPQWAADPSGRHRFRYWDGTAWTGHVFDGEVPPATAPAALPTESAQYQPVLAQPSEYEPVLAQPTQYVVEPYEEHVDDAGGEYGSLEHHRPTRSRRSFWMGALVGGFVVAIIGAVAWVTVGGSTTSKTTVVVAATTTTSLDLTSTTLDLTSTTLTSSSSGATSTTVATGTARPPAQVRVEVLNGSAKAGAAGSKATALKTAGYTIAGAGNAAPRQGTVVTCKTGFDAEAAALAQVVGSGATTEPFPTPAPTGSTNADCVVILGK